MIYSNVKDIFIYIRQLMIADGISVSELATRMNKSQGTISGVLRQNNVTMETLNDICKALGYELEINIIPKENSTEKAG